jgi:large subunit ribosomal protein L18
MKTKKFYKAFRRKEKTDYKRRLTLLKSGITRLVPRFSSNNLTVQLINYDPKGDIIVGSSSTQNLVKLGWKASRTNTTASYLVGYMLGKKCSSKVKEAILDMGKKRPVVQSKIYAVVKGMIDAGIKVLADEAVLPKIERIKGDHIKAYAEKLQKESKEKYAKVFSLYLKNGLKPETLPSHFEEIKSKIK